MARGISLAPCGLIIERIEPEADALIIVARQTSDFAACPTRGHHSNSIHSRDPRLLSDLLSQGKLVRIKILARRFRCVLSDCRQRIFVERLEGALARPFARRTSRLEGLVHHLGLALGGRPGQSFARRLLLPVSKDTLLRVVRRHAAQPSTEPRVIGIDDLAWKRGHRYGTINCDLERRRLIDILPDCEAATVAAWLTAHPSITVIARDRGVGYKQAATDSLPDQNGFGRMTVAAVASGTAARRGAFLIAMMVRQLRAQGAFHQHFLQLAEYAAIARHAGHAGQQFVQKLGLDRRHCGSLSCTEWDPTTYLRKETDTLLDRNIIIGNIKAL